MSITFIEEPRIEFDPIHKVYWVVLSDFSSRRSFCTYSQAKSHLKRYCKRADGIKKQRPKMISPVKQRHDCIIEQERYFDRLGCG